MNENKVPCGGFRIGDGLTMEGDTLKSLGGAYIKVVPDEESPGNYKIADDSPLNHETAMKYDGLIFILLSIHEGQITIPLYAKVMDTLVFHDYEIRDSSLTYTVVNISNDNLINIVRQNYILTPAT